MVDIIIIGGGISGSYLAYRLKQKNLKVLIIEKSKGIGGRLCTKPVGENLVDYGCQYISPKSQTLVELLETLKKKGIVEKINTNQKDIYISPYGMNKVPQYLSLGTPCITNSLVESIVYKQDFWTVNTQYNVFNSRFIVLTMPINQVQLLLRNGEKPYFNYELPNVRYKDFFTATFEGERNNMKTVFDETVTLPWICNNTLKGLRNSNNIFTVNFSPKISSMHQKLDSKERILALRKLLEDNQFRKINHLSIHYWKYAYSSNQSNISHVFDKNINLGICGDSFSIGKVDGAIKSSDNIYHKILSTI